MAVEDVVNTSAVWLDDCAIFEVRQADNAVYFRLSRQELIEADNAEKYMHDKLDQARGAYARIAHEVM